MSVENTIKSLLEESRKLKDLSEANRVTKGAVAADGMQKISSPDKMGGENEYNKRNNVDDEPEAKGGTSKKANRATQDALPAETMSKLQAEAYDELTEDEMDLIESLLSEGYEQLDELSRKTLNSYLRKSNIKRDELERKAGSTVNQRKKDKLIDKLYNIGTGRRQAKMRLKGTYEPKSVRYHAESTILSQEEFEDLEELDLIESLLSEGYEQLDELSRKTLNSYLRKSKNKRDELERKISSTLNQKKKDKLLDKRDNIGDGRRRAQMRLKGVYEPKAVRYHAESTILSQEDNEITEKELDLIESLLSERYEQLDELSRKTLNSYLRKSRDKRDELERKISSTVNQRKKDKLLDKRDNIGDGRRRAQMRLKGTYEPKAVRYHAESTILSQEDKDFDVSEDVNALFNGEDGLTEEFRQKAETIFEAAVVSRVKEEVAYIEEQYNELLESRVEEIEEGLVDHIDGYLNLMVEQWMEQNEVALESGMKSDILESFVGGLKNLFAENYIEVPEEKFDVVADLEAKLEEATQKIDEVYALNVELRKQVNEHARQDIIASIVEGLSDLEVEKFSTLAEEIAFEDSETFAQKMQVIRENYFAKKPAKASGNTFLTEGTIQEEKAEVPASMAHYVQAINMTVKK